MDLADRGVVALELAMDYRDGLTIALLAYRPLRARNLAMIACGEHLVQRDGVWYLVFTDRQTKSGRRHETPFPAELVPHLEKYLATYRPVLLTKGGQQAPAPVTALWVSRDATALGYGTIAHHVRKHTRAAFGVAMTPHLFRDAAATAIAIHDPEHVNNIMPVLGHATLTTSEQHYNQAQGLEAGRRYHGTLCGDLCPRASAPEVPATRSFRPPRRNLSRLDVIWSARFDHPHHCARSTPTSHSQRAWCSMKPAWLPATAAPRLAN